MIEAEGEGDRSEFTETDDVRLGVAILKGVEVGVCVVLSSASSGAMLTELLTINDDAKLLAIADDTAVLTTRDSMELLVEADCAELMTTILEGVLDAWVLEPDVPEMVPPMELEELSVWVVEGITTSELSVETRICVNKERANAELLEYRESHSESEQ
jgi:hypothetical protein